MLSLYDVVVLLWAKREAPMLYVPLAYAAVIAFLAITFAFLVHVLLFKACLHCRVHERVSFYGGGVAQRRRIVLCVSELQSFRVISGDGLDLEPSAYVTFSRFVRPGDVSGGRDERALVVDVPLATLVALLPYKQLVALAKLHNLHVSRVQRSLKGLCDLLKSHKCNMYCSSIWSQFELPAKPVKRIQERITPPPPENVTISTKWLSWFKCVGGDCSILGRAERAQYVSAISKEDACALVISDPRLLAYSIPLRDLMIELPRKEFLSVLAAHGISIQDDSMQGIVTAVVRHSCQGMACSELAVVFSCIMVLPKGSPKLPPSTAPVHTQRVQKSQEPAFPPPVHDREELMSFVDGWCDFTSAASVYENPCLVCGRLTALSALFSVDRSSVDLKPLCRPGYGVTRRERKRADEPVQELEGPILYRDLRGQDEQLQACAECLEALRHHRLPRYALANGLWTGNIPEELQKLNFVEKLLVAVERHNVCIGKVTKGQHKMTANAVVYAQPVGKFHSALPPKPDELAECLTILFVGPCKPLPADLKRTPFIVRRKVVLAALRWLILNHRDYEGISVSYENLAAYGEEEPPVNVIYRVGDGEIPVESQPGYGGRENEDVKDGECTFAVHGLTESDYVELSRDQRVAAAIKHFDAGGGALAYGHAAKPSSMYHNPQLYPRLFPWLYPYGLGGFDNTKMSCKLGRAKQIQHRLMYADQRFQVDRYFPFLAFNQEQIRASTTGGFLLTERAHFKDVAAKILSTDKEVLQGLIDKGKSGWSSEIATPEEKQCHELLALVDFVAAKVPGSMTQRRNQRSEIKSLIIAYNVPMFFVTFAPVDFKHPICLYYCGEEINLTERMPDLPSCTYRLRAIASNPVACARFFDLMVRSFVTQILRVDDPDCRAGLFGKTSTYYGTVEEQGRLTLHLHALLWIQGSLSPQDVRDRMLSDETFRNELILWLEQCQQGDYTNGTQSDVAQRMHARRHVETGIAMDMEDAPEEEATEKDFRDPCTVLPAVPPADRSSASQSRWWEDLCEEVDDVVYLSNRHDHRHRRGCLRGNPPYCKARFPRQMEAETAVDLETGALKFRKTEEWINTFNIILSYVLRCNTDVTSLLSGTQVRAVVAYITDYITKTPLKTYSVFEAVKAVLERRTEIEENSASTEEAGRRVLTKVVNILSARREMGGPAVCSYLLGNPDRYTNRVFKVFFWYAYVKRVLLDTRSASDVLLGDGGSEERVVVALNSNKVVGLSKVNDYVYRPKEFENMPLYDYLRSTDVYRIAKPAQCADCDDEESGAEDDADDGCDDDAEGELDVTEGSKTFNLLPGHPLRATHAVRTLPSKMHYVLNFSGGVLPRKDRGDKELYSATMLTLFCPRGWRVGGDLLGACKSWNEAFEAENFKSDHVQVMRNMNVLYECLDARDDYSSRRKTLAEGEYTRPSNGNDALEAILPPCVDITETEHNILDMLALGDIDANPESSRKHMEMEQMKDVLTECGYASLDVSALTSQSEDRPSAACAPVSAWKDRMVRAKEKVQEMKRSRHSRVYMAPGDAGNVIIADNSPISRGAPDAVRVVTRQELLDSGKIDASLQDANIRTLTDTLTMFTLNTEQQRAFVLIAKAVHHRDSPQMKMYLGGMAGTGKSQVLKALTKFMELRNESYRLMILAPTGSSACNVDGSTYHSALCLGRDFDALTEMDQNKLAKLRDNFEGVDVVFLDEISMVSCVSFYVVSASLAAALNRPTQAFGGCHVIVAGDFGQLPPPGIGQIPLYSDKVDSRSSSQTNVGQMNAMGQALWRQFTTVVLLRENMRQRGLSDNDRLFRRALENLRVKECTEADRALFRSRIVRRSHQLKFTTIGGTSIITARNSHRDAINNLGSRMFALHRGQKLHTFRSVDTWSSERTNRSVRRGQRDYDKSVNPVRSTNTIHRTIQEMLWDIPPCMTEHHAGTLELCIGMPVLLKNNEATELCATNGAEGVVHDWQASSLPNGEEHLEVLFVRLINPPKNVQIEGLPQNVVPIPSTKKRVKCVVPTGSRYIYVERDQVMVLPNFAMSDFASQGRTRPFNPCHLKYCRTSQSLYTCLSRSASLDGTFIIGEFDENKMYGGLPGPLMREFIDFEVLDDITRLDFEGKLAKTVPRSYRSEMIAAFTSTVSTSYQPPHMHGALDWSLYRTVVPDGRPLQWRLLSKSRPSGAKTKTKKRPIPGADTEENRVSKKRKVVKGDVRLEPAFSDAADKHARPGKRKQDETALQERPRKQRKKVQSVSGKAASGIKDLQTRGGFMWDSANYSCAYDSLLTILWNIRLDYTSAFVDATKGLSPAMDELHRCFEMVDAGSDSMEGSRNCFRDFLNATDSARFPRRGAALTAVADIIEQLVRRCTGYGYRVRACAACTRVDIGRGGTGGQPVGSGLVYVDAGHYQADEHAGPVSLSTLVVDVLTGGVARPCRRCGCATDSKLVLEVVPPLLCAEVYTVGHLPNYSVEWNLKLEVNGRVRVWSLRGLIYWGADHFTSRFVDSEGRVWFHDGISTGSQCILETNSHADPPDLLHSGQRDLTHAIFVLEES